MRIDRAALMPLPGAAGAQSFVHHKNPYAFGPAPG